MSFQLKRNACTGANNVTSLWRGVAEVSNSLPLFWGWGTMGSTLGVGGRKMMLILGAQAFVFAIWTFLVFRALLRLLALLRYRSGEAIPGISTTLSAPRVFLTDHAFRQDRRWLGLLSLLLVVLTAIYATQR